MERKSTVNRKTTETDISLELNLDGKGISSVKTGIGFFDHMLEGFSKHGYFDLNLNVKGDLQVDGHHTVEDTGIVMGEAIKKALQDKKGIARFGFSILPMDDALILCAVDLSGRPYLNFDLEFPTEKVGEMDCELAKEFFYAISYSAGMNIHFKLLNGCNSHHIMEAAFKSFAKALDMACSFDKRNNDILSTKGSL